MNQNMQVRTADHMVEAIFALDLDPIKVKLMDKKEGQGWTRAQADRYALEYRRFLALLARFPDEPIAPDTNVDKFWHGHILDTMKYAADCDRVFGCFLHHFPYFGMRGEDDAAALDDAFRNMQRLYRQEFGDPARDAGEASAAGYCAATQAPAAAYCARASASYCAVAGEAAEPVATAAYCARAGASYCAVASGQAGERPEEARGARPHVLGLAGITDKGRPTLAPLTS